MKAQPASRGLLQCHLTSHRRQHLISSRRRRKELLRRASNRALAWASPVSECSLYGQIRPMKQV
eukprot:SM000049S16735  [mRNA]  locus=s49:477600:478089:+ [translate_table: standard]